MKKYLAFCFAAFSLASVSVYAEPLASFKGQCIVYDLSPYKMYANDPIELSQTDNSKKVFLNGSVKYSVTLHSDGYLKLEIANNGKTISKAIASSKSEIVISADENYPAMTCRPIN